MSSMRVKLYLQDNISFLKDSINRFCLFYSSKVLFYSTFFLHVLGLSRLRKCFRSQAFPLKSHLQQQSRSLYNGILPPAYSSALLHSNTSTSRPTSMIQLHESTPHSQLQTRTSNLWIQTPWNVQKSALVTHC